MVTALCLNGYVTLIIPEEELQNLKDLEFSSVSQWSTDQYFLHL